jgi:hypothetical protein
MPQGICKLCLLPKDLRESHFIPRAMYKYIRAPSLKNPNPIVASRKRSVPTSKQIQDYLLCADCEDLFNKGGENEALKWVCKGNHFPLVERLALAHPHRTFSNFLAFSGPRIGIDTDVFAYFAASVIWRAAVHVWNTPSGKTALLNLAKAEEPIRLYLHNEAGFPTELAIVMSVCTDLYSQRVFFTPTASLNFKGTCFVMLLLGLHFMVYVGSDLHPLLREMCCVRSPARLIYQRDCKQKTLEAYRDIVMSREQSTNPD